MDLREFISPSQLQTGIELIKSGHLFYQPFILHENLEVGEGQNFCDRYENVTHIHDFNVWSEGFNVGKRKFAPDKNYFRKCNADYRAYYHFIAKNIKELSQRDFNQLEFAEIGCNTGLMLFELAKRGAKHCIGYDWNDMQPVFNWLNDILKTNVNFVQGTWDNLYHQFTAGNVPETDVMINTIYTNHQFDPLQFLAYICDRSRVGVFLWVLITNSNSCVVEYPEIAPHIILDKSDSPFPANLNNGMSISEKMLSSSLKQLGFGKVTELNPKETINNPKWDYFVGGFRMFYAERTSDVKSAFWQRDIDNAQKNSVQNDNAQKDNMQKCKPSISYREALQAIWENLQPAFLRK